MAKKIEKKATVVTVDKSNNLAFTKENYLLLVVGFTIVIIGFLLMIGGKANSPDVFNPEVFSTRRIVVAPMVALFGFCFIIYAIVKKSKK